MTGLMLESRGPDGLYAIFQEDEGAGYFFAYQPETQKVLAQIRVYESGARPHPCEGDIQLLWSSDGTKCGIALFGQMRGVINVATLDEVVVPLGNGRKSVTDPHWLKGFEKDYLDINKFIRARQRYWKEMVQEDAAQPVLVLSEEATPPETNFVVYAIGSDSRVAVFEDEGDTGYLYLYSAKEQTVVRHLHIYDRSKSLAVNREEVRVMWSDDGTKCGVLIWGKMRGIIDVVSDREGRVWLEGRDTPGIGDTGWLSGFRL